MSNLEAPACPFTPRNEYVIVWFSEVAMVGGLHMPERSAESKRFFVLACGPKVTDLKPGDEVMLMGEMGQDLAQIPRHPRLIISKEANILLVVKNEPRADGELPPGYDSNHAE